MGIALKLAIEAKDISFPNPMVGAVLVKNNEVLENSWIITNSSKELIFHNDLELSLWKESLNKIGIDPKRLVSYSGSA